MSEYDSSDDELTVDTSIRDHGENKKHHKHRRPVEEKIIVNNFQPPQYPYPYPPVNPYSEQQMQEIRDFNAAEHYLTMDNIPINPLATIAYGNKILPDSRIIAEQKAEKLNAELRYLTEPVKPLDLDVESNYCPDSGAPFLIGGNDVAVMDILNQKYVKGACNPYLSSKDMLLSTLDLPSVDPPVVPGNPCATNLCRDAFGVILRDEALANKPAVIRQITSLTKVSPTPAPVTDAVVTDAAATAVTDAAAVVDVAAATTVTSSNPCQPPSLQTFDASKNKAVTFDTSVTEITVNGNKGQPNSSPYPNALIILPDGNCDQLPDGRVVVVKNTVNFSVPVKGPHGIKGITGVAIVKGNKTMSFRYTKANGWTLN